ncbi:formate hydrogenlyase [Candidatus Kaiserbacteria bacterium CG_4_8_14_3_um_filter_38_9]|uniref:Formate hydrogenlyase n=1 Tax=Candidatus Kaiserbacteria bacterium CG_4_8_14_3_um_filter_38_9 TaxID=1974599 RepID=A0A2M7IPQ9_9BACT|nr:MAG: formate hydrogenlyase [Candidatus Kaiserbacteria bacterium CG_4_8_14_3_um_filter_38_9]
MNLLIFIIQLSLVTAISPLCTGIIKKIKAHLQNRHGASVFQPYYDIWKLLHKDEVISRDASFIFRLTPFIIFAVTVFVGFSIPLFTSFSNIFQASNILVIIYTLAIGTFFLALAGMDSGSPMGGFGSSREMTVSALAEGGFIFSLLTVALINHSTDLFTIASANLFDFSQSLLPIILAFSGFLIVLLAETARFPFDNPATHLELTMIHESMILEYSGKRLALMEWATSNKLVIFIALGANLFFPLGLASEATLVAILIGLLAFVIKIIIFSVAIASLESSLAKFRFFRLPDLLLSSLIINAVAIALIF